MAEEESEIKFDITFQLEVDLEENTDLLQSMMEEAMEWERDGKKILQPAVVYSDCPYANYVEFGTLPGMEKPKDSDEERVRRMERWVQTRLNETDGKRVHDLAVRFKKKIETEGICPSPYMRSSVEIVTERCCPKGDGNATDYLEKGGSLQGIADAIRDEVKGTLRLNKMEITHALIDSIKSEPITSYSISGGEVLVNGMDSDSTVTEEMWQDKSLGRGGKRPTRFWRYPS